MHATSNQEIQKIILTGIFVTFLLVLISSTNPLIGIFGSLVVPLPILFYRTRLNRKHAAIIPAAVILLLTILGKGFSPDIFFFTGLMLLGFLLSESFEMNFSIERTILFSCGGVMLTGCFILFFYSNISNTGIYELLTSYMEKSLYITLELYKEMGFSNEELSVISKIYEQFMQQFIKMFPGICIVSTTIIAWINILISGLIFKKHDIAFADFGSLKLWKAPERLVWVAIISGMLLFIQNDSIKTVNLNIFLVLKLVYFFQGIAIVSFYFDKKNFPRGTRTLLYTLILFPSARIFVIGIGFFDMWVNFRKTGIDKTGTHND